MVDTAHEELLKLRRQHYTTPAAPSGSAPEGVEAAAAAAPPDGASALPSISTDRPHEIGTATPEAEEEWSQVGKRNKAAVTRQVGVLAAPGDPKGSTAGGSAAATATAASASSLLHAIFCGSVRSVIKVRSKCFAHILGALAF